MEKYRAWHKKYKKMYQVIGWMVDDYGQMCVYCKDEKGVIHRFADGLVALMQYTGLDDKYGREIYKGDVFEGKGVQWTCVWSRPQSRYIVSAPSKYNPHGSILKSMQWAIDRLEPIGNIYEMPTLQGVSK